MATWTPGNQLSAHTRADVLRRYVHRCTTENFRQHPSVKAMMERGGYRLRILSDAEWLECTQFPLRADGAIDERIKHCWSTHPDTGKTTT